MYQCLLLCNKNLHSIIKKSSLLLYNFFLFLCVTIIHSRANMKGTFTFSIPVSCPFLLLCFFLRYRRHTINPEIQFTDNIAESFSFSLSCANFPFHFLFPPPTRTFFSLTFRKPEKFNPFYANGRTEEFK